MNDEKLLGMSEIHQAAFWYWAAIEIVPSTHKEIKINADKYSLKNVRRTWKNIFLLHENMLALCTPLSNIILVFTADPKSLQLEKFHKWENVGRSVLNKPMAMEYRNLKRCWVALPEWFFK